MLMKKILILGHTGKMGTALQRAYADNHEVVTANSSHFDAARPEQVQALVESVNPDFLINAAAFVGVDACELDPVRAFQINTLFPKQLAELSQSVDFTLVHLSTDAVFADVNPGHYCTEEDMPQARNIYGFTKLGGEQMIQAISHKHYVFRLSVLFGPTPKNTQFVEKMLILARSGQDTLRISDDIISTPSYSQDLANHIRHMTDTTAPFGLYHLTNQGEASLYGLIREIFTHAGVTTNLEPASYRDFPSRGIKNLRTPMRSNKISPLRPWREAVHAYCQSMTGLP